MTKNIKVLMYGWEFPPHNSGGLGTACYGLTKSLSKLNTQLIFVLPTDQKITSEFLKIIPANTKLIKIQSPIRGYLTPQEYCIESDSIYGPTLFAEVERFSQLAKEIAQKQSYDIIHAHDWMTYPAGINAQKISGKPLIIHVHATEFDRTGGHGVNPQVYQIEKQGMQQASQIIAVSNFTKNMIMRYYQIPPEKITVIHNAVEFNSFKTRQRLKIDKKEKIILFLGRITIQKGPDWFIQLAKKILDHDPNYKFIIAGSGDMQNQIINKINELNISDKVLFTGFLRGDDIDRIYQMADLYVMPSISEPFGITPLEAMRNSTPCLISKQSGISEVINHCLKADYWDIDKMADQIIGILKYSKGYQHLKHNAKKEVRKFTWDAPAQKCFDLYQKWVK